jgi:hypothetical protein
MRRVEYKASVTLPTAIQHDALDWLHDFGRECHEWLLEAVYYPISDNSTELSSDVNYDVVWFSTESAALMFRMKFL